MPEVHPFPPIILLPVSSPDFPSWDFDFCAEDYIPHVWIRRSYIAQYDASEATMRECDCAVCRSVLTQTPYTDYTFVLTKSRRTDEWLVFAVCRKFTIAVYREHTMSYNAEEANKRLATLAILDAFEAYAKQHDQPKENANA